MLLEDIEDALLEAIEDDIIDDDIMEDDITALDAEADDPPTAASLAEPSAPRTPPYTCSGTVLVPAVDAATINAPIV